jgi:hypothetical protein
MDTFEKASQKMIDAESEIDRARRFPVRYPVTEPKTLDEKYAEQDPKGARRDAWKPTVGDPSGKTPAQADELAMIRASDEYTRAHRNYLERARNGEKLTGVESFPDGSLKRAFDSEISAYGKDQTAEEDRNDTQVENPALGGRTRLSTTVSGSGDSLWRELNKREVDNLARREAVEVYQQERARAK